MTGAVTRGDLWIRPVRPAPDAALRLFCFPHAGGAVSFFRPLFASFPGDVDVVGVQYPGRQDRRGEPQVHSIERLADDITAALTPAWTDLPFAFFGHSMGAIVAFEVALRLPSVSTLVASGRSAPSVERHETVHRLDDRALIAEVAALSGTQPALLTDPDVLAMVLPPLRADYRAIETYRPPQHTPRLNIPITAMIGESDPRVTVNEANQWRHHTTKKFALHVCAKGDHFYLTSQPKWTTEHLANSLPR